MENRPALASVDAPLVLRRSPAVLAYVTLLGVLLLGGAALLAVRGSFYALPVAALGVFGPLRLGVVWARARTEIGPEGIRNRTVRAEVLIPWPEIIGVVPRPVPGTVVVVRRAGRTPLAGLRGSRSRGAPSLDQVVETIEARIEPPAGSSPPPVPPVIVRRLRLAPARDALLTLTSLGVLAALTAVAQPLLALAAVKFLGLAGFFFAATKCARTEIGPDGIRNRALVRTVFVPWSDVAEVEVSGMASRTVRIMRPGGKRMTLAAVRDTDVQADGLGLGDVADVVRERAATGPTPVAPLPRPRTLSLRPSRRPLMWIVPLLGALFALMSLLSVPASLVVIFMVPVAYLLLLASRLLWSRTEAAPAGLRNRLGLVTTVVSWNDIEEFVVVPTLFGRVVRVSRPPGRRFTLAAPREGLLGRDAALDSSVAVMRALAAVDVRPPRVRPLPHGVRVVWWVLLTLALVSVTVVTKPWLEPWWPTRHEATSLPRACEVFSGTGRLVPDGNTPHGDRQDSPESATSYCSLDGASGEVSLELDLHRRAWGESGTQVARRLYGVAWTEHFSGLRPVRLPGLGDEAWAATSSAEDGRTEAQVYVRHHNVRVEVDYTGRLPAGEAVAGATALARTALTGVPDSHDPRLR